MGIRFGRTLDDVTADADELRTLLETPVTSTDSDGVPDSGPEMRDDQLPLDPDPGWEEPGLGERLADKARAAAGGGAQPRKVTAAVRRDIQAKIAMLSHLGASAWQVRDEHCGTAAVEAVPDFAEALTDIIVDSPDLVAWFTGGGGYMKWFKLAMAVQPVVMTVVQHHVTHTIGQDKAERDWSQYAAA